MDARLLAAAVLPLILLTAGCTSSPAAGPAPRNPSAPLVGAGRALVAAEQYLDNVYQGSVIIVPFTLTRKMQGGPCAWDGPDAGNATKWMMVFEGIIAHGGFGRHLVLGVTVEMRDQNIGVRHVIVSQRDIDKSQADAIYDEMDNVSLASNISFDNHALFLRAEAARWNMTSMYYLQSATMTIYDNSTSPRHPGRATWEVSWKYIAKDTIKAVNSIVMLDAVSGDVLRVIPP